VLDFDASVSVSRSRDMKVMTGETIAAHTRDGLGMSAGCKLILSRLRDGDALPFASTVMDLFPHERIPR
jgi:hypothetical protein